MRFNQFSYIQTEQSTQLKELQDLGFELNDQESDKKNLEQFVRRCHFLTADTDQVLANLLADWDLDLLSFFQSDLPLSDQVFYHLALQLLGFVPGVDYEHLEDFISQTGFPIIFGNIIDNLYQLLNTRTKSGNLLVEQLVSDGLIPENNEYHFFNGKSLATFSTRNLIREVVYVETSVDTTQSGQTDLVKVSILRPAVDKVLPAIITNSPYHQGVNAKASDAALHKMEGELVQKEPGQIHVQEPVVDLLDGKQADLPTAEASEKLGHISSYSLNDYLLARGFASLHVSGVGTLGSTGHMTSGDYQQVHAFKAVIDWLNGRALAYTDHKRQNQVLAYWSNGKVATTGLSYLGTMSNALATTGVDGLEVIIAEAGISSWYDYYRENGLVTSPGGYPGEDLDSLTAFTYSRSLQAGDYLRSRASYQAAYEQEGLALDRLSGDYNQYWHDRNYLLQTDKVKCQVVFTHGSQDWNVKPIHVWNMFHALPDHVRKHLFLHNGAHVYMNNWQSIDFRESMNALLSQKLLGYDNQYELPTVIWQDNRQSQTWISLANFGSDQEKTFPLGEGVSSIQQAYNQDTFAAYCKSYPAFQDDLLADKANQITLDMPIEEELHVNGRARLQLKVKSSVAKGLLSAQIVDFGSDKRLTPIPTVQARNTIDNGRFYAQENLTELPFTETPHRVVTKSHLDLQNRTNVLTIEEVTPDQWMTLSWDLQPTIYTFKKGSTLRLILYTTDFEVTIRDNSDWAIHIDLAASSLEVPVG